MYKVIKKRKKRLVKWKVLSSKRRSAAWRNLRTHTKKEGIQINGNEYVRLRNEMQKYDKEHNW